MNTEINTEMNVEMNTEMNAEMNTEINTDINTEMNAEINTEINIEMNSEMNIKMHTDKLLEFDKIRAQWKTHALTKYAADLIDNMDIYLNESELRRNQRDTTDARDMIAACGMPPLVSMDGAREIVGRAVKEGCLMPEQLSEVEKLLTAVRRLKDYLDKGKQYENPLAWYEQNLDALDVLRGEIAAQVRNGEVDDYASRQLAQVRGELARTKEKMKEKAQQAMRAQSACMADQYCTVRSGHICIPVKKEFQCRVKGSVIDRSASGNTVFMEPAAVAKLQERVQVLELEEEQEVSRILYTLTAMVADEAAVLEENMRMAEKLDFIFSKGKLSIQMDAVPPKINLDRYICMKDARHPLMPKEQCVPLQFTVGGEADGIVITGPNTGGKTVAIKTVALNCLLAQCGLHVTCREADICMNSMYLCDIGDGQSLTENLSTFSAHIKNVLEIVGQVDADSLVVMDELGSGTDPTEGMGIAVAILEELKKSGCLFLATTHYPEVKEYAARTPRVLNARMEFDKRSLQPTYRMVIGEAGESCAFYIAKQLGMPKRMLETAKQAAYGNGVKEKQASKPASKSKIKRAKTTSPSALLCEKFQIGDSVLVLPDQKIGIVCEPVNEKGVLRVQLPGKKIWISHKRVKLHVAAEKLYPDDYDFSIVFDTVKNRKIRHAMERKYTDEVIEGAD